MDCGWQFGVIRGQCGVVATRFSTQRWIALLFVVVLAVGCAGRKLAPYERPLPRSNVQHVRTTAYTHTEADHIQHGRRNAMGTRLRYGAVKSAAADWSRWPAGTRFRIRETGEVYEVDDYGWMLAGTNTIDLYKPSRSAMNHWGVRHVTIEILRWGDIRASYNIMYPRRDHRHVRLMVKQIEKRY